MAQSRVAASERGWRALFAALAMRGQQVAGPLAAAWARVSPPLARVRARCSVRSEAAAPPSGVVYKLVLGAVWLTAAAGAIVFTEPAPSDLLAMALVVALPVAGLVTIPPFLVVSFSLWLACAAGAFVASAQAQDLARAITHSGISLYLYASAFVLAAFVAKRPLAHGGLILRGWLAGATLAAAAGVIGYFQLFAGAEDVFTRFGRAAGTFKDPNVFGPFLIPALLYALHLLCDRPLRRALLPAALVVLLTLALLVSFSRGAWFNAAVSTVVFLYLSVLTTRSHRERLKLVAIGSLAGLAAAAVLILALQSDSVEALLAERAALTQSYDEGPDGRFGGQEKAGNLILERPLGVGALEFSDHYHSEDVHNVYLSMFLNAGWVGGWIFALLVLLTCFAGLAHAFRPLPARPLFLIAYAAFVGVALEGFVIDIDHWRHFYLLFALVWGMMAAPAPRRALGIAPSPA